MEDQAKAGKSLFAEPTARPRTVAENERTTDRVTGTVEERLVETDSTELPDGTQIEIIEDPEDSLRTLLAVFKDGEVHLTDRFRCGSRIFVPIPRSSNLIHHVRLPRGVERYESVRSILNQAMSILYPCLDLEENDIRLLAQFASARGSLNDCQWRPTLPWSVCLVPESQPRSAF